MNYVTTNIRLAKSEYESLKNLAYRQKRSLADIIRQAISEYRKQLMDRSNDRKKLLNLMIKSRIKIDIPVVNLVKEGRRFE